MLRALKLGFPGLWVLILAQVFVASLFYTTIQDILLAAVVLGLLAFGYAVAVVPGFTRGWQLPRTGSVLFLLAFWLYLALSTTWSSVPGLSIVFVYILGTLPFIFFTVILAPGREEMVRLCMRIIGLLLAVLAAWAVIQFLFLRDIFGKRIHHPLLYANNLAALMCMPALFTLGHFFGAAGRRQTLLHFGLFILFLAALLATQSRGGMAVFGVAAVTMVAIGYRDMTGLRLRIPAVLATVVALYFAMDFYMGMRIAAAFERMHNYATDSGVFSRLELWRSTWRMIQDHFWGGTGLGTFIYYYPSYRVPKEASDGFFTHSDPLQLWSGAGVLAPVLFYAFLTSVLLRTDRALRTADNGGLRIQIATSFCALLGLALHAHIDFQLYVLPILFPAAVLLAFWYLATERALADERYVLSGPILRPAAFAAVTVVFVLLLGWILRFAVGVFLVDQSTPLIQANKFDQAERVLERADFWAPESYSQVSEYQGRLAYARMETGVSSLPLAQREALFKEALGYFDESLRWSPMSPSVLNFKALTFYTAFRQGIDPQGEEAAIALLTRALEIDPIFVNGRIGLAEIYLARGDKQKALEVLLAGINLPKPRTWLTVRYLMQTALLFREVRGDDRGYNQLFSEAKILAESISKRERRR